MSCKRVSSLEGRLLLSAVALAFAFLLGASAVAQEVTFKFNPPDGTTYVQTIKSAVTSSDPFSGKVREVTTERRRVRINKTPFGFSMVSNPMGFDVMLNGKLATDDDATMLKVLMKKAVITYGLDSDGRMQTVTGYDAVVQELGRGLAIKDPAAAASFQVMLPSLTQGAITEDKDDWAGEVSDYVGKTMKFGELWKSTLKEPAYSGNITVNQRTRLVGPVARDGHNCVKLRYYYAADPKTVKAELAASVGDELTALGIPRKALKVVKAEINGTGERIVDPETMLFYAGTETITIRFVISSPRGKLSFSMDGKNDWSYHYETASAVAEDGKKE